MPEMTVRDHIVSLSFVKAYRAGEAVYPEDIAEKVDCSERTVRDCLNNLSKNRVFIREQTPDGTVRYTRNDDV